MTPGPAISTPVRPGTGVARPRVAPTGRARAASGDRPADTLAGMPQKLILDVDENRYIIPDMGELPSRERELFERYVYW